MPVLVQRGHPLGEVHLLVLSEALRHGGSGSGAGGSAWGGTGWVVSDGSPGWAAALFRARGGGGIPRVRTGGGGEREGNPISGTGAPSGPVLAESSSRLPAPFLFFFSVPLWKP